MRILPHISALALAAITALAPLAVSCSGDEPSANGGEIIFHAKESSLSLISRSGMAMNTLDDNCSMKATTLLHTDTYSSFYFNDKAYQYKAPYWRPQGNFFYPFVGSLDLVAYCARKVDHQNSTNNLFPAIAYESSDGSTLSDHQFFDKNAYLSKMTLDFTQSPLPYDGSNEFLVSNVVDRIPCDADERGDVELSFNHLFSNIRFKFTAQTDEAEKFFQVTGIDILNVSPSGVCELTRSGVNKPWGIEWTSYANTTRISEPAASFPFFPLVVSKDVPTFDFFIPAQNLNQGGHPMRFRITFRYSSNVQDMSGNMVYMNKDFEIPDGTTTFLPGYRYTYNIICNMLPHVEFQISLIDDENDNGPYVDLWQDDNVGLSM